MYILRDLHGPMSHTGQSQNVNSVCLTAAMVSSSGAWCSQQRSPSSTAAGVLRQGLGVCDSDSLISLGEVMVALPS